MNDDRRPAARKPAHAVRRSRATYVRRRLAVVIVAVLVVGVVAALARRDDGASPQRVAQSSSTVPTSAAATASPGEEPAATSTSTSGPPRPAPPGTVTISAVGDTILGKGGSLPPNPATYLSAVSPALKDGAQIVFGNLEGTLSDVSGSKCAGSTSGNCFAFQVPPDYAQHLASAGFTVLNAANNHSHDFGQAGLDQTVKAVRGAGMEVTGLPGEVAVVDAGGIRVGFVGFAPYRETPNMLDLPAARDLIRSARGQADVVVVYMHAGAEGSDADHVTGKDETYLGEARGNAQQFAHMAIDEGAALVLGSGPHVLRGAEFYKGHLIAYSLGNFAGYANFVTTGDRANSAILHVTLDGAGTYQGGHVIPVALTSKNQPKPGGNAVATMAALSEADFGPAAAMIASDGTITPP